MFQSLSVTNFRGLKSLTIDNLARVNLITGSNNIGKTSLLEAIMLHCGKFDPDLLLRESIDTPTAWRSLFGEFNIHQTIRINGVYDDMEWQTQLQLSGHPDLGVEGLIDGKILTLSRLQARYRLERKGNSLIWNSPSEGDTNYISANFLRAREYPSPKTSAERFSGLHRDRQQSALVEALQAIEPRLEALDLLYEADTPVIYGEIGLPELIPLVAMGEGVGRVAGLVLAIGSVSGGVLAVDEIENGLHYSIMPGVWKAIATAARAFDVQVFATTHSFECIAAAHEVFVSDEVYDFRLHRLERTLDGGIRAVNYKQEILATALEANFEVR